MAFALLWVLLLAGITEDQAAQGAFPADPGRFQGISGMFDEARGGDATSTHTP